MAPKEKEELLIEVPVENEKQEKEGKVEKEVEEERDEDIPEDYEYDCTTKLFAAGAVDAAFGACIVAPLVVSVWRGTWGLMEMNPKMFPHAQSFLLGITVHICFAFVKVQLLARSTGAWGAEGRAGRWLRERVLSKIYTYVFVLSNIMHWRGGWGLLDALIATILPDDGDPHRPVLMAAFLILFYISIASLRAARNLLASPYFVFTDGKEATYMFTTRFKRPSSREMALYILDCIFSVAVVGSLVVFVWRGSWALLDIYLFPDDPGRSFWTSLIAGYTLVFFTFSIQAPMRWVTARLHGAPKLLIADLYHLVSFLATVNVWRGVWGLLDLYLFPESPKLSNWCTHIVSLLLLMLLNCSNSVLVRGVYIDAEEPAGECVVFPCHYLRLYFYKERTKKRHKRALSIAAARKEDASLTPLQLPLAEEKV